MFKGCRDANKAMRDTILLPRIYDVKAWLDPILNKLHNHSHPHIFKFVRDSEGISRMLYKNWNHDHWLPEDSLGISLLQVCYWVIRKV